MPRLPIPLAAAAAIFALPLAGLAQSQTTSPPASSGAAPATTGQSAPAQSAPAQSAPAQSAPAQSAPAQSAPSASTGAAANTSATAGSATEPLAAGMTVKDNTGAAIGQIAKLGADASGKAMATIKMGADTFQAPAEVLAVQNGAATINLTKAEIDAQLHGKKKS
ncbi:MAG TPA: hypothetical protein VGF33_10895 [Caulobacteraceae bacterium]|jgi:hypothetical protein